MKINYISLRLLLAVLLLFSSFSYAQNELFISETGNDNNSGTINEPLATLIGARNKARQVGARTIWIRGGRYNFDKTCTLGAQDNGITISGYRNENVIFDGSIFTEAQDFKTVTNQQLLNRLHPNAKGKVKSAVIRDKELIEILSQNTAQISIDDEMKTLARFPNIGFTHIDRNSIDISQEKHNTDGTHNNPTGGTFKITDNINASKWGEEIKRTKAVQVTGYVSAEWLSEDHELHSVNNSGVFRFVSGTRYGLDELRARPRRFFIYNILYELDEPGEWYFDKTDSRLYVWFDKEVDNKTIIGAWAGPQLFEVRDARDITIKKMTIQNLGKQEGGGKAAVNIIGKSDNILVAGILFRFIAEHMAAVNIWHDVTNSSVLSCDMYDGGGSRLYGGRITPTSITYGRNRIENCHFTQVFSKSFYGKACGMDGAGNIFRNNLIHNINGQPVTHRGHEHLIERNELFNVGIEEGDGGAIYTGNAIWSYNNVVKHNFIHHIMSIPKLIGRASIHVDDLDAGDKIEENVMYKGGWRAIKFNNGSGHNVFKNVLLNGYMGIRDQDDNKGKYKAAMDFISKNDAENRIKANYVGRMLKAIGIPNWQNGLTTQNWHERVNPFWMDRYPKMQRVFKRYNDTDNFGAYETRVYDNLFANNMHNIDSGPSVGIRNNRDISMTLFQDVNTLNFKFKEPRPSYAPNIPFENIGLYKDEYRCAVPNKAVYRRNVRLRFDGQASWDGSVPYDFATINERLYYNSGRMVFETIPCADVLPEIAEEKEYRFDLGTANSKVFDDYIRVSNVTKGINFGWTNTSALQARDRGLQGTNDLNRDFVQSKQTRTFEARVVNGNWNVLITFGDKDFAHDNMQVKAEGEVIFNDVDTKRNEFFNRQADVDVKDGKLSIEFSDRGGNDDFWQATRIWLRRNGDILSTEDTLSSDELQIYPNPAKNALHINYSKSITQGSIQIIDNLGRIISSKNNIENQTVVDVSTLSTGIYFLKIKIDNQIINKRFIKK